MLPALIVGGRTKAAWRTRFQFDPFEKTVEGEIEVEPCLFAIGDYIHARGKLVVNGDCNRVLNELSSIVRAKFIEVIAGKLQPARKRIAADDGRSQRMIFHSPSFW